MNRQYIEGAIAGTLIGALLLPLAVFAARTAIPVITGLFPTALSINLPAPIVSLGNSTTTGSVYSNGGQAIYFAVTALDNAGGETYPSNMVASSTGNQAHGWNLTWGAVQGAYGYRVYFSTSTALALTQYFNATSTTATSYTFTSTSSPVFIPAGAPGSNTAYNIRINSTGNSWVNGGRIGVGTSTPQFLLHVVNEPIGNGVTATTTVGFGDSGTTTSRGCINLVTSAGTAASFYINGAGSLVVALVNCT